MSPFGPYASFDDCVAKNGDKTTPEAFCAWLQHHITGQWPSQNSMPPEAWNLYINTYATAVDSGVSGKEANDLAVKKLQEANWFQGVAGWTRLYQAPTMRNVQNVRVFAVGKWTDSSGSTRDWSGEDLDKIVENFNNGIPAVIPLKAGHTSDTFNEKIAKELGIPVDVVTGDLGQGQISLGRMVSLERRGDALFAAFDRVPDEIASLIEGGQFNTVSVEIDDLASGPAITAVAMLGAEEPAVDLATLDRSLVFGGPREGARVITMTASKDDLSQEFDTLKSKMAETIKGMRGAPIFRALMAQLTKLFEQMSKSRHTKEGTMGNKFQMTPEEQTAITELLGLPPEATFQEILQAIDALKTATAQPPEAPAAEQKAEEQKAEFTKMSKRLGELEHRDAVHEYMKETSKLHFIEGTPEAIAEELATLAEKNGEDSAKAVLATYQKANEIAEKAAKAIGTSRKGKAGESFDQAVTEYSKSHPDIARADCLKYVMNNRPDLYQAKVAEDRQS